MLSSPKPEKLTGRVGKKEKKGLPELLCLTESSEDTQ